MKNKDADANNPNLYQYVDDNKLDHVYDEIKHKEGYGRYFYEYIFNILGLDLWLHILKGSWANTRYWDIWGDK